MLRKKMVINHTQVFSYKILLLPSYLACTANSVFQQPAAFCSKTTICFLPENLP